jgi:hypothetical protein
MVVTAQLKYFLPSLSFLFILVLIFAFVVVLFNGLWQFTIVLDGYIEEAFLAFCYFEILHHILRDKGRNSRELLCIGDLSGYLGLSVSAAYRENMPRRECALTWPRILFDLNRRPQKNTTIRSFDCPRCQPIAA